PLCGIAQLLGQGRIAPARGYPGIIGPFGRDVCGLAEEPVRCATQPIKGKLSTHIMPTIAELMRALLEERGEGETFGGLTESLAAVSMRPVPVGRLRRLGLLGTLQAKVAAAYLFYWVRGWFQNAGEREKSLAEAHWKAGVRVLDSMSYLRGAAMKVGQTLANFPDIVPSEFVDTLEQLHYNAPPMHWALLREMVQNELGDDPENLFASFSKRAFA